MSSMVQVTRTEYHTFVENMVAAFGEENVLDRGSAFGRDPAHVTVYVNGEAAAALHLDNAGGNSCMQFFDTLYTIDSAYLSWRDTTDHADEWKPTEQDTVTPFLVAPEDRDEYLALKKAGLLAPETLPLPKPRLLSMRKVTWNEFARLLVDAGRNVRENAITDVFNSAEPSNTCYVYNGQVIGQVFYTGSAEKREYVCLAATQLRLLALVK